MDNTVHLLAVFTTVSSQEDANHIARVSIEKGLAACTQIDLIESVYRWKNDIVQDAEYRLMFKTTSQTYPALKDWLSQVHPYELPAIYALPVSDSTSAYENWVHHAVMNGSSKNNEI